MGKWEGEVYLPPLYPPLTLNIQAHAKNSVITSLCIDSMITVVTLYGNHASQQLSELLINQCYSNASSSLTPRLLRSAPASLLCFILRLSSCSWTITAGSTIFLLPLPLRSSAYFPTWPKSQGTEYLAIQRAECSVTSEVGKM